MRIYVDLKWGAEVGLKPDLISFTFHVNGLIWRVNNQKPETRNQKPNRTIPEDSSVFLRGGGMTSQN